MEDDLSSKITRLWFGPFRPIVNLVHPTTVKKLQQSTTPKSVAGTYAFLTPWLGEEKNLVAKPIYPHNDSMKQNE